NSEPSSIVPHGISTSTVGVSALAHNLLHFKLTSQVPAKLAKHVVSFKKAQANWYRKLLEAWKEASPKGRCSEVIDFFTFVIFSRVYLLKVEAKAIPDRDTISITVYVSTANPRESSCLPEDLQVVVVQRAKARAERNYPNVDVLQKKIVDARYKVLTVSNEDVLARKYKIRLG
ncbi:hypothetical protein LINPERPRIM_LOCUS6421, partial [Linum perenne]